MSKAATPLVQDPGLRHLLRATRRALLMIVAAIDQVAPEEEAPRKVA